MMKPQSILIPLAAFALVAPTWAQQPAATGGAAQTQAEATWRRSRRSSDHTRPH